MAALLRFLEVWVEAVASIYSPFPKKVLRSLGIKDLTTRGRKRWSFFCQVNL